MYFSSIIRLRISCQKMPLLGKSRSVANSRMVMPRLKMSAAFVGLSLSTSAAKYLLSPSDAFLGSSYAEKAFKLNQYKRGIEKALFKSKTSPKSPNLQMPSVVIKMLEGLMSTWIRSWECMCSSA
jgi:hypothetical protein